MYCATLKSSYIGLSHSKILLFFISLILICGQYVNTMSLFLTLFIYLKQTMLYSVWDANSRMCDSMVIKRNYVQQLRQEVKLGIVLKEQVSSVDFLHI
jgi:hypothetical protein